MRTYTGLAIYAIYRQLRVFFLLGQVVMQEVLGMPDQAGDALKTQRRIYLIVSGIPKGGAIVLRP